MQAEVSVSLDNIPSTWKYQTIENCCNILDSKRIPLNSEERKKIQGDIPYYGANGVQGYINKHIFDEDLILLAEDGGYFTEYKTRPIAYYVTGKCWVNNHAHVLSAKNSNDLKWIFYSIVNKNILPWIIGSTRTKLNQSQLRKITIPIPPLAEQQKIASILSNVDSLIQKTDQIIEQTRILKKGLMQRLLTKGIGHTKFKKTEVGNIPEEWKIKTLVEVADLNAGGTPSRFKPEYWENGTIPWLSSGEVKNNIIIDSIEKITEKGLTESAAKLLPKGTVLIAITGQGLTRGRTALLEIDSTTNQSVIGIICNKTIVLNSFLWYYLQNQYWNLRNLSQGSNQAGLNLNIMRSYIILLPSMKEQQKIASILSNIDELIQKQQTSKSNLGTLKKGLMQQLLTGKIRVKV